MKQNTEMDDCEEGRDKELEIKEVITKTKAWLFVSTFISRLH